jgi:hypothetical protein
MVEIFIALVKSKKGYSINFSQFSRAMTSPLSTENPTPGGLIDEYLSTLYPLSPNHDVMQATGCIKAGLS